MRTIICLLLCLVLVACEERKSAPQKPSVAVPADPQTGERVYRQACAICHKEGIAGAPKMGDREAWQSSIAKGMEALVRNSIGGFQGNRGVMPPKGGAKSLTDEEVAAAVAYMVEQNR